MTFFSLAIFAADRIVKYYFLKNPAAIIGGDFLRLHFEKNFGIAFGLGLNNLLIIILVCLILMALFAYLLRSYRRNEFLSFFLITLIIAGAVSNLLDRLKFGYVIDYIDVPWFTVFNLADSAITVGALVLALNFWISDRKTAIDKSKPVE